MHIKEIGRDNKFIITLDNVKMSCAPSEYCGPEEIPGMPCNPEYCLPDAYGICNPECDSDGGCDPHYDNV